jgi:hypothetical protein
MSDRGSGGGSGRKRGKDEGDVGKEETGWLDDLRNAKSGGDLNRDTAGGGTDRWAKLSALSGDPGGDEPPGESTGRRRRPDAPPARDGLPPRDALPPREPSGREGRESREPREAGPETGGRRRAAEEANRLVGRRARDEENARRADTGAGGLLGRRAAPDEGTGRRGDEGTGRRGEGRRSAPEGPERETGRRRSAPDEPSRFRGPGDEDTGGFGRRSAEDRGSRAAEERDRGSRAAEDFGRGSRSAPRADPPRNEPRIEPRDAPRIEPGAPLRRRDPDPAAGPSRAPSTSPFSPEGRRSRGLFGREREAAPPPGQPPMGQPPLNQQPPGQQPGQPPSPGRPDNRPLSPAPSSRLDLPPGRPLSPAPSGRIDHPLSPAPSGPLSPPARNPFGAPGAPVPGGPGAGGPGGPGAGPGLGRPPAGPAGPGPAGPPIGPMVRPAEPGLAGPGVGGPGVGGPGVGGPGAHPRARAGLAAGVEAIRGARSEVRRQLREQQRLRMWTLVTLVVAVVGALPFYFVLQAATRDPVISTLNSLAVPAWAATSKEDVISGSRWCLIDCRLRERIVRSTEQPRNTTNAYRDALLATGWTPLLVPGCEPIDEDFQSHSCWQRDEFTLDLTVTEADCEDPLHNRPRPSASADVSPGASGSPEATASAAPNPTGGPPQDCVGSKVSIKVFNAIADDRLRFSPEPTTNPGELTDDDLMPSDSPSPTP